MNDGAAIQLIEQIKKLRAELNQNAATLAGALAHLTQEIYLQRKVAELWLDAEKRAAFAAITTHQRPEAPQPDLRLEEPAREPTQAEIDEINRALNNNTLEVGVHGLPMRAGIGG